MDPATISIILGALVKYGPDVAEGIYNIFAKPNPTEADFREIFQRARSRTYDEIVAPKT